MHVIIIGNGITGITAAINIRQLSPACKITIISSESKHFYSRTALMYVYMGHMTYQHIKPYEDWFWQENQIDLVEAEVTEVSFETKEVCLADQHKLKYDKLLIATGSVPNTLAIPGNQLQGVQGFYSIQDLEKLEAGSKNSERAVIIGGGLIGIELAEMFYSRCIPVTFLVRENRYWGNILPEEESVMIENHIRAHGIDLRLGTTATEMIGDNQENVKTVITDKGESIHCNLVGVAIGVKPNISFLNNSSLQTIRGVLVNEFLETNISDVWAAGDCAELRRPNGIAKVEQLWYTGRMQGQTVAYGICGKPVPYERGVWFNSAKFFDIEYQTYGQVPVQPGVKEETLFWQHSKGQKSLRINFNSETLAITGFNLLGIRYRQAVCEAWIKANASIFEVLPNLKKANFDPEFYRRHEKEIASTFRYQLEKREITQKQKSSV